MPKFRLDRFLTLYFFHPFLSQKRTTADKKIPILMYHSISDDKENTFHPYYHINTTPTIFAEHMRFLSDQDYSVIDLKDLSKSFTTYNKLTKKIAVITFDDGYRDFYTNAFSILQRYHFPATVFLPTASINDNRKTFKDKECLTWAEVRELFNNDISFGSHTVTHPELSRLNHKDVEFEIRQSKKTIEDNLGETIDTFSYPFKFPDENKAFIKDLREILKRNEYSYGVSTRIGTTSIKDDIYFMKRIPINSDDDISLFKAKLDGFYNWLYQPQYLYKILKRKLQRKAL